MSFSISTPSALSLRSRISLEAEVGLGVTGRLLDLLVARDSLPQKMDLLRDGQTMTVTMEMPGGVELDAGLLAQMREIPGVRAAGPL